jgi:hypothetical protein
MRTVSTIVEARESIRIDVFSFVALIPSLDDLIVNKQAVNRKSDQSDTLDLTKSVINAVKGAPAERPERTTQPAQLVRLPFHRL